MSKYKSLHASEEEDGELPSFITPGHVRAFQMVTSGMYDGLTLSSCTINGEPGVAIVLVQPAGEEKVAVMPLFVAITPTMDIEFVRKAKGKGGRSGKSPNRPDVLREFEANMNILTPGGAA